MLESILRLMKCYDIKINGFYAILFISIVWSKTSLNSQIWTTSNSNVRLFSSTPVEDIDARTNKSSIALNISTAKVFARIPIKTFKFDKKLMQEHFNENYMESDKFPYAEFSGQITNKPDLTAVGTYQLVIKGTMNIHGVKKEVEIPIALGIFKDKIIGKSSFKVKCSDYNIEIPKLIVKNIAEEVELTVNAELKPHTQ